MLVDFDKFGMAERPVLTLQYPQGNELGQLGSYQDFIYEPMLTSYSTISFKYPYYGSDNILSNLYEEIATKMRVEAGGLGSFIITGCEEENDGINKYKHVTANSLEIQMCRRKTNLLNGTYKFYDSIKSEETLLGLICKYLPTWHVEYVSSDLENKWRTFDVPDATLYDFLMNDVSKAYECMFVFDTINRGICAYSIAEIVKESDIYVGYGNFLKSEKIEEISDDITTVMSCYGGDGVNIASVNPLGSVFLYNFSYFKPMMSEALRNKIDAWEILLTNESKNYAAIVESLKIKNRELIALKADLRDLESKLAALEDVQAVRIAAGKTSEMNAPTTTISFDNNNAISNIADLIYKVIVAAIHKLKGTTPANSSPSSSIVVSIKQPDDSGKMVEVNSNIATLKAAIANKETEIAVLNQQQKTINDKLKFSTGTPIKFTDADLMELEDFKFESTHQDDNYIITDAMDISQQQEIIQDLYDSCETLMKTVSAPTYNITADSANFLFIEKLAPFFNRYYDSTKPETLKQLLGTKFHLEKEDGNWIEPVLLKLHINFDDPTDFSMEFSTKYRLNSATWAYADLIGEAVSSSGNMSFDYSSVKTWTTHKNEMLDFINGNLDASKNRLINSEEDNTFLIDHTGLRGSSSLKNNGSATQKGIWLTADTLAFTDDNWETVKTAVGLIGNTGKYGINAEVLIGKAIFGTNLTIQNEANTMIMDTNGLLIQSAYNNILLNPSDGIKITDKNNNNKFYADSDGNLIIDGKINAGSGTIAGFNIVEKDGVKMLSAGGIELRSDGTATLGDLTISNGKATFAGTIYADQIISTGNRYLNAGVIKDGSISDGKISGLDGGKITANTIGTSQIQTEAVTANEIKSNTITTQELRMTGTNGIKTYFDGLYASYADIGTLEADIANIEKAIVTKAEIENLIAKNAQIDWLQGEPTYQNGYYKVNVDGSLEASVSLVGNNGLLSRGWLQVNGDADFRGAIQWKPGSTTYEFCVSGSTAIPAGGRAVYVVAV